MNIEKDMEAIRQLKERAEENLDLMAMMSLMTHQQETFPQRIRKRRIQKRRIRKRRIRKRQGDAAVSMPALQPNGTLDQRMPQCITGPDTPPLPSVLGLLGPSLAGPYHTHCRTTW
ncbi:unnamed protein product [Boreogadus saida]